ncbi:MAG: GTP-binding protein [Erysipelotrichaceae bacterium]|nr:GTP-binding protein [Erysipelotrichaceae bacterium]
MSKVDIISGFLGAGKTTLIKKFLTESLKDEKIVLIENEFGQIGIDGGFMREAGIVVNELSQGCICCSLVGDFEQALKKVLEEYAPDRIIIEPSGVGKLSDIIAAVQTVKDADLELDRFLTVVDAKKCKLYHRNFGEFFNNQIAFASCVVLSRTQEVDEATIQECLDIIHELNDHAPVITTPWDDITGDMILEASHSQEDLEKALIDAEKEHQHDQAHGHHHHHHHHDHDEHDEHEHHHHDHDDHDEHEHHHHDHDEHDDHDEHEHHHHDHDDHDEHEHHHHHHHHHDHDHDHNEAAVKDDESALYFDEEDLHDADEVFDSVGIETAHQFTKDELLEKLEVLDTDKSLGNILRAKGIVRGVDQTWYEFDFVAGDYEVRETTPDFGGRMCVIGEGIDVHKIYALMKG